jgi:hypothetical protein
MQPSIVKDLFEKKLQRKFQKKFNALTKLSVTAGLFAILTGAFVFNITTSSTKGYILNNKVKEHTELLFNQDVNKSDILILEKELREKVSARGISRQERSKNTIVVHTWPKTYVAK